MDEDVDINEFAPWLVLFITLAGGFLRVLLLDSKGMWLDETFSVWLSSYSAVDMLQWMVKVDQHPPLYYLLLHCWVALNGDAPGKVRLLSALLGTGTIPLIYLIGKRISGSVMGLAAAVFLALSTFNLHFAQETRMYTLLAFNAAAAMYALVRLLTDPRAARPIGSQFRELLRAWRTPAPVEVEPAAKEEFTYMQDTRSQTGWRAWLSCFRWSSIRVIETDLAWIALIVFSAATMFTHNTAVFFLLAANVYVLGLMLVQQKMRPGTQPAFQAPSFWNWVKAQVGIFLLWSPWIPAFIKQSGAVYQRFWIPDPTWDGVIQLLKAFLNSAAPIPAGQAAVIWTLYVLVLCLGLAHFRKKISHLVFLAALFAVPFLGELVVSIWRPIFLGRTLIWITIPLFLLLAAGVAQFKHRFLVIVAIIVLGAINLFSASDYFRFSQKEDWSTPAGYVALYAEKDDLILFNSNFVEIPFNYYFETWEELYSIQVIKRGFPLDLFDSGVPEPLMTEDDIPALVSLLREHDRVWLVYSHELYTDPEGLIPQTFAAHKKLISTREFYGGRVELYANP